MENEREKETEILDLNEVSENQPVSEPVQESVTEHTQESIEEKPLEEKKEEEPISETIDEQKEEVIENNKEEIEENSENNSSDKEEKKKSKKGLIFTIVILFLIGAGVCAYAVLTKPKEKEEPIKNEPKQVYSKYRITSNGLTDFDLYFLQLENIEKNKIYSPLSIKYALEMLAEGSNGDTKKQIDDIIGEYKANKYPNSEHMSFANAMFIKDSFKNQINDDYTKKLKDKYNAEVITDPFTSPDNINNWVSDRTFKLVNNLVSDVKDNDFFLINALAIDMEWNYQIHCVCSNKNKVPCYNDGNYSVYYNHEKIDDASEYAYEAVDAPYVDEKSFYHLNFNSQENTKASEILADYNRYDIIKELGEEKIRNDVSKAYAEWLNSEEGKMTVAENPSAADVNKYVDQYIKEISSNNGKSAHSTDFMIYEDETVKTFAKDLKEYDGLTLQYVGIMPKNEDLTKFVKNSSAEKFNSIIDNLKELKIENFKDGVATIIRGDIPLFKYDYELKLMEDLNKLGIKDVFEQDKADLSNMTTAKDEYINKAIHKANIEFSNEGIKAAAVTTMGGSGAVHSGFDYLYKIPVEKIDLTFNKPYMYIIRDKKTGEVWFVGTVYEPIK